MHFVVYEMGQEPSSEKEKKDGIGTFFSASEKEKKMGQGHTICLIKLYFRKVDELFVVVVVVIVGQ